MDTRQKLLSEAVLTSTHNLCFRAKIRKTCKPQFYYIKVGCKWVYITRTCYPDDCLHIFDFEKLSYSFVRHARFLICQNDLGLCDTIAGEAAFIILIFEPHY